MGNRSSDFNNESSSIQTQACLFDLIPDDVLQTHLLSFVDVRQLSTVAVINSTTHRAVVNASPALYASWFLHHHLIHSNDTFSQPIPSPDEIRKLLSAEISTSSSTSISSSLSVDSTSTESSSSTPTTESTTQFLHKMNSVEWKDCVRQLKDAYGMLALQQSPGDQYQKYLRYLEHVKADSNRIRKYLFTVACLPVSFQTAFVPLLDKSNIIDVSPHTMSFLLLLFESSSEKQMAHQDWKNIISTFDFPRYRRMILRCARDLKYFKQIMAEVCQIECRSSYEFEAHRGFRLSIDELRSDTANSGMCRGNRQLGALAQLIRLVNQTELDLVRYWA